MLKTTGPDRTSASGMNWPESKSAPLSKSSAERQPSNGVTMPISDCQVRDPRIRRTRKLLQGALGSLMQTKSFDEISVQDITEAATVNRATFYDHYTDKFALLEALVAGGFHELLDERNVRYQAGCPSA